MLTSIVLIGLTLAFLILCIFLYSTSVLVQDIEQKYNDLKRERIKDRLEFDRKMGDLYVRFGA